jgi:thiosulfate/3-mercaptopyruvate sulfurtransferase
MTRPRLALVLLLLLMLLAVMAPAVQASDLLVGVEWLRAHGRDADVRLIDMASEAGSYRKGHIPGAIYLHVNDARIAVPDGGFRLPTVDEAERLLGDLGIRRDTHVVIYDDAGGLNAARLFFTLDVMRHPRISLLDGGIESWRRAGQPLTTEIPRIGDGGYRPELDASRVVTAEWIRQHLNDPTVALVDARSPAEYAGRDVRAKRGGHIPGAINIEWKEHLQPDGRFKPTDELRALFASRAVTSEKLVVTYCQTHHRAAETYFILRLLGYPRVVGYDRSWAEWGNREDLPLAR